MGNSQITTIQQIIENFAVRVIKTYYLLLPIPMSSKHPPNPQEAGFTIIESLVAILVVSALLTAIAPVIGISAANRVQAKRIEQAANASKAYLDSIRSGESPAPPITNRRFASEENAGDIQDSDARVIDVNGNYSCTKGNDDYKTPYFQCERAGTYEIICADGDGNDQCDSFSDLYLQVFAYHPDAPNTFNADDQATLVDQGYNLGMRIYRVDAFAEQGALETGVRVSSTGNGVSRIKAPLWEMQAEISSSQDNYNDLCRRFLDNDGNSCGSQQNN